MDFTLLWEIFKSYGWKGIIVIILIERVVIYYKKYNGKFSSNDNLEGRLMEVEKKIEQHRIDDIKDFNELKVYRSGQEEINKNLTKGIENLVNELQAIREVTNSIWSTISGTKR